MPQIIWPWGIGVQTDPNKNRTNTMGVSSNAVLTTNTQDAGEFSFAPYIPTTLSNAVKNAERLFDSTKDVSDAQAVSPGPAWYNLPARLIASLSTVNDALQSTLIKVIVLVTIVGIIALFGLSYVQAKGTNLAK